MSDDLTAILLPAPPRGPSSSDILAILSNASQQPLWVRLMPMPRHAITQLEVLDGMTGLPMVSPALLGALSRDDRKAIFVHTNSEARQAMLHAFEGGEEVASLVGEPGEAFTQELSRLVGHTVPELLAADDGTRQGFGQAASRTAALLRGRVFMVPPGTPTGMGSFAFHDRGGEDGPERLADRTRVAFFAFDHAFIKRAWDEVPARDLAQVLGTTPPEVLGPLFHLRDAVAASLREIGVPPGQREKKTLLDLHAFEMLALAHAAAFSLGDALSYYDQRVLPLLSTLDVEPVIDGQAEAEELCGMPSLLDMMAEVLPCERPPGGYGQILESLGNAEVHALTPWARPGEEYAGSVFLLEPGRLLRMTQATDGNRLGARLDRFCSALFTARHGRPAYERAGAANGGRERTPSHDYLEFRKEIEERSQAELDRFVSAWAELRLVLEMAASNQLAVGMVVYEI